MRAKEIRAASFAKWLSDRLGSIGRRWAENRERARLERVAQELLRYDDKLLKDAGLSRRLLKAALADRKAYRSLEDLRRRAGAELVEMTGRLRDPSPASRRAPWAA